MEGARKPGRKKKVKRGSQKSANIDPKLSKVERKRRMDQLRKSLTKGTEDEEISQRGGESSEESTQGETSQTDDTLSQDGESQSLLAAKDTDASQSQYPQTPNVLWKRKRRRQP